MDSAKKVMWIIPFKKFGLVRVNLCYQNSDATFHYILNTKQMKDMQIK